MIIDFHAHVLPEMDHGCISIEMAKIQLTMAKKAGVDVVIATSHYTPYLETVESYVERRDVALKQLLEAAAVPEGIHILPASEILLHPGVEKLPELDALCIKGTNCMLVEMPLNEWDESIIKCLQSLCEMPQYKIVLAHFERYDKAQYNKIKNFNIGLQVNSESICSFAQRRYIMKEILQDNVVAIGSDIHGTKAGYKYYAKAMRILGDKGRVIMNKSTKLLDLRGYNG